MIWHSTKSSSLLIIRWFRTKTVLQSKNSRKQKRPSPVGGKTSQQIPVGGSFSFQIPPGLRCLDHCFFHGLRPKITTLCTDKRLPLQCLRPVVRLFSAAGLGTACVKPRLSAQKCWKYVWYCLVHMDIVCQIFPLFQNEKHTHTHIYIYNYTLF